MKAIAESLVLAVTYLDWRPYPGHEFLDENCDILDQIGERLQYEATEEELQALAEAAERLLQLELARSEPEPHFVEGFGRFMEDMVGHHWVGNRRGPETES
jgi:hypothetical protein